jgi:hypothetical protein
VNVARDRAGKVVLREVEVLEFVAVVKRLWELMRSYSCMKGQGL